VGLGPQAPLWLRPCPPDPLAAIRGGATSKESGREGRGKGRGTCSKVLGVIDAPGDPIGGSK